MVNTRFWNDNFIASLSPIDRYLFLYFLTNEHTNIAGIYELPLRTIVNETGVSVKILQSAFKRFSGKIHYIEGWVYVKNFQKHQSATSFTVQKGITSELEKIPPQIRKLMEDIDRVSGGMHEVSGDSIYLNSNSNSNSNSNAPQGEVYSETFESFWKKYPRKIGKGAAWRAWKSSPPGLYEKIISSVVEHHSRDPAWKRDGGQYIPHPATYLNQKRWEDEIPNLEKTITKIT